LHLTSRHGCPLIVESTDERFCPWPASTNPSPTTPSTASSDAPSALRAFAAGKSQTDAADHLDCSFQQIQKYESGINRIPVDCLVRLAAYLDAPVTHFTGTPSRSKETWAIRPRLSPDWRSKSMDAEPSKRNLPVRLGAPPALIDETT
jgi:transcriptional regulator with XRE-family HTH domain